MDLQFNQFVLNDLGKINVIVGKNGSGKSTLLRAFEQSRRNLPNSYVRYITPERGGVLNRDGSVETNISNDVQWLSQVRGRNRFEQFRQTSAAEFRRLETLVLRKIEKTPEVRADSTYTFDTVVSEINTLLENVEIVRSPDGGFGVRNRGSNAIRDLETLSSGEAELISLGIEFLSFAFVADEPTYAAGENWLLVDEPDVHLHPDLQHKLMALLQRAASQYPFNVCISTHSTSIVSALAALGNVNIAFMGRQQIELKFEPASAELRDLLPIFGAHPLSNFFNEKPVILVEGEDDERIWQQAVRTSAGAIAVWPCVAGDVQSLNRYETKAKALLDAIYDSPVAYSIRDRDNGPYEIDDIAPVVRMKLNCRAAENLLMSNDVLQSLGLSWEELVLRIETWADQNPNHQAFASAQALRTGGWARRDANIKPLRIVLMALAESQRPWEVVVGQAIAGLKVGPIAGEFSLTDFLGPKLVAALKLHP